MIGDIIVDKLRIVIPLEKIKLFLLGYDEYRDEKDFFQNLEEALSDCFPKGAYRIYKRYRYYLIEFNPTRMRTAFAFGLDRTLSSGRFNDEFNLQMIPEVILLGLFQKLGLTISGISNYFNVVELNITKNFVLNENVNDYIKMLANAKPYRINPIYFKGERGYSIYFSSLTNKNRRKEYSENRIFKFYDKKAELCTKTKNNVSSIKLREKLTEYEQSLLGKAFDSENNIIDFTDVNFLRIELTYKLSNSLKKVCNALEGNEDNKCLPLSVVIKHLKENTLYSGLDKFFKDKLEEYIFCNNPEEEIIIEEKSKVHTKALPSLKLGGLLNTDSDLYYLKNILKNLAFGDSAIIEKLKNINSSIITNPYYDELYNLIYNEPYFPYEEIDINNYPYPVSAYDAGKDVVKSDNTYNDSLDYPSIDDDFDWDDNDPEESAARDSD